MDDFLSDRSIVGHGSIHFHNGDYFEGDFQEGFSRISGTLTKFSHDGLITEAEWKNGLMEVHNLHPWSNFFLAYNFITEWISQGQSRMSLQEGGFRLSFYHCGLRHGISRDISYSVVERQKCVSRVGFYENDAPCGIVWRREIGNGFTVCTCTNYLAINNSIFLYSDWIRLGKWIDQVKISKERISCIYTLISKWPLLVVMKMENLFKEDLVSFRKLSGKKNKKKLHMACLFVDKKFRL